MHCVICRRGMRDGVDLFRINEKGVPGLWACQKHMNQTDAPPVSPEVASIVEAINPKGKR